jgi:hypothetical protein
MRFEKHFLRANSIKAAGIFNGKPVSGRSLDQIPARRSPSGEFSSRLTVLTLDGVAFMELKVVRLRRTTTEFLRISHDFDFPRLR